MTRRETIKEAIASSVINAVFSVIFFLVVFGGQDRVPVWGVGNLVFDGLPQGFMVALMATLVPSLIARRKFPALGRSAGGSVVLRGLLFGIAGAATVAGGTAATAMLCNADSVAFGVALPLKVAAGAVLGGTVTFLALQRLQRSVTEKS